jgi:hypothetical protein
MGAIVAALGPAVCCVVVVVKPFGAVRCGGLVFASWPLCR